MAGVAAAPATPRVLSASAELVLLTHSNTAPLAAEIFKSSSSAAWKAMAAAARSPLSRPVRVRRVT